MQFCVFATAQSLTMLNVLIESFRSCGIARDGLEIFRLIESCVHAWLNLIFPRIYMKKLAVNVNSAIDDWSSPFMRKESRATMTAYARTGRLVALAQLAVGSAGSVLWFASVFLDNRRKVFNFFFLSKIFYVTETNCFSLVFNNNSLEKILS